jgi:hypothetical protein
MGIASVTHQMEQSVVTAAVHRAGSGNSAAQAAPYAAADAATPAQKAHRAAFAIGAC